MAGTLTVQNLQGPSSGANANKIIVPSGQELYAPGHVMQVVEANQTTQVDVSASSSDTVLLTCNITPTSANSKILVSFHLTMTATDNRGTAYNDAGYARVMRGGSTEVCRSTVNVTNNGDVRSRGNLSSALLDAPNTTSAITYTLQVRGAETAYDAVSVNSDSTTVLLVQEIAQ